MRDPFREGEPLRFSLASLTELPAGPLSRVRRLFADACAGVVETRPRARGLHTLSMCGRAVRDGSAAHLARQLRAAALPSGADCALTRADMALGGPRLIVSDVDSTFIDGEVIEMLAEAAGSAELVSDITARAMAGELDFAQSLTERVATLEGLPASVLADVAASIRPVEGAGELVRAAHARAAKVGLVSGGFHEVVDVLAADLGIDEVLANRLEVRDGVLTGRVSGPIVTRQAKAQALEAWAGARGIELGQTVAMGDGANDLDMMAMAGLSIGVMAKPVVANAADAVITRRRLDTAIALFGWDAF